MTVTINGEAKGHAVNYHRTFNVTGMSKLQKDALIAHLADSLQVPNHNPTAPPTTAVSTPKRNTGNEEHLSTKIKDDGSTMHIKISGMQQSNLIDFERTYNVSGMSATEKNSLVRRLTDSLGIGNRVHISKN
jgi:hypothetical protein